MNVEKKTSLLHNVFFPTESILLRSGNIRLCLIYSICSTIT